MQQVQLVITMTAEGKVGIEGPLENKLLCYGLLEFARQALYEHGKAQERIVQPVTLEPPRRSFGGKS